MAKLVDALDLGSSAERLGGSSPSTRTIFFLKERAFLKGNTLVGLNKGSWLLLKPATIRDTSPAQQSNNLNHKYEG